MSDPFRGEPRARSASASGRSPPTIPASTIPREEVRIVTDDGALVRGMFWTPPGGRPWHTAVVLTHPRADFSVHYACPLLAAAGFAVLGFATRYLNNDTDCLHDLCARDVAAAVAWVRARGADAVVLFGNSGGGSLMALAHAEHGCGDGWVGVAAHPGEGVFMLQAIDPSVADEARPVLGRARARHVRPRQRLATVARAVLVRPDVARRGTAPRRWRASRASTPAPATQLDDAAAARDRAARRRARDPTTWRQLRKRAVHLEYMTIYRTLADPAYLDPSIDPDDRPLGSLFAFPDPFDANYGRGGLARTMTSRGWLSTWSGLSSAAKLADTMPNVHVPVLVVHPTADTEIRVRQAREIADARRQRRRHVRTRSRARPTTSKATAPKRWRSSPTGSRARFPVSQPVRLHVVGSRGAADVRVAGHVEAVGQRLALAGAEADARRRRRARGRRRAVVDDAAAGRAARLVPSNDRSTANACPSRPGPAQQVAVAPRLRAPLAHHVEPASGAAARSSTACACSPGPHTAFMHQ